jgi:hypothetical protein
MEPITAQASELSLGTLDIQEFDIDLLDSGAAAADAPVPTTFSSWVCVTITIISVSATAYYDCLI